MNCPKCIGKLQKKEIEVDETSADGKSTNKYILELDQCFSCGGVWFEKGELEKYTKEKLTIIDSPSLGKEFDSELDVKDGLCPVCNVTLSKRPYNKNESIIIDVCGECGGIWLDSTEIDRIEKTAIGGIFNTIMKIFKSGKK